MTVSPATTRPSRPVSGPPVVLVHALLVAAFVALALGYPALGLDVHAAISVLSIFTTLLFVWSLWSWRALTGSLFDPYGVFFVLASLFNTGQVFLEAFRLNDNGILDGAFSEETTLRTLLLATTGLAGLHLGALSRAALAGRRRRRPDPAPAADRPALRAVGWLLLAVSAVPAVLLLREAADQVRAGGYMALYQVRAATGLAAGPRILA